MCAGVGPYLVFGPNQNSDKSEVQKNNEGTWVTGKNDTDIWETDRLRKHTSQLTNL